MKQWLSNFWDSSKYFIQTVLGVFMAVGIFASVLYIGFTQYQKWVGGMQPPPQPSLSLTDPASAHLIITYYQKVADVYIYDNSPGTIFLSISVAVSALVAGLAAYKILPKKGASGADAPPSPLSAIVAATIAFLTVISTNATTYYSTVTSRIDAARVCKSSLSGLELDIPDGLLWEAQAKNAWKQSLKTVIEKYPHVLFSTNVFPPTPSNGSNSNTVAKK